MAELPTATPVQRRVYAIMEPDSYIGTLTEMRDTISKFDTKEQYMNFWEIEHGAEKITLISYVNKVFSDHAKCRLTNMAKALCGPDVVATWDSIDPRDLIGKQAKLFVAIQERDDGSQRNVITDVQPAKPFTRRPKAVEPAPRSYEEVMGEASA